LDSTVETTHLRSRVPDPRLVALDWGTSSLRTFLLGDAGILLEERFLPFGIMRLPAMGDASRGERRDRFEIAFEQGCGDWVRSRPSLPVIAAGMVGSAQGWCEAPYLPVPVSVRDIGNYLIGFRSAQGHLIRIVPGLKQTSGPIDVMRGEETQVLGALPTSDKPGHDQDFLFGLPGTHSKWVDVSRGQIVHFTTYMTGEVYAVLCAHTILGQTMDLNSHPDPAAFEQGVRFASSDAGEAGFLSNIFSTRALGLVGSLSAANQSEYLSGILIAHELGFLSKTRRSEVGQTLALKPIILVGEDSLCTRYLRALKLLGYQNMQVASNAMQRGLWNIAVQAQLVN
jgi:2-dehydro-3-deoxygalactonokinase